MHLDSMFAPALRVLFAEVGNRIQNSACCAVTLCEMQSGVVSPFITTRRCMGCSLRESTINTQGGFMLMYQKVVLGDADRAVVYKNRRFDRVLGPGVHRLWGWVWNYDVFIYSITQTEYTGKDVDILIKALDERLSEHFVLADIRVDQVGLVSKNGKLDEVLAPGTRKLYWKGLIHVQVDQVSLQAGVAIDHSVMQRLRQLGVLERLALVANVPNESVGLLFVDGKLVNALQAGAYAFWNFQKNVSVDVIDLRVQAMEVSGQELLTKDKVSLRVNLAGSVRVADAVLARTKVAKYVDFVYRELQYGLRKAISAKTLDELLGDKASLDADIFAYVQGRTAEFGIDVLGVGVKDIILPGDMKDILNSVVQAEKTAQANVIRRREEANATRSLLNTAKLMEDNAIMIRLKELETLEKVTEKIDKLTVFGGLDGVLKQLVSLKAS
jgi:regulator of protease activity HflC (stomatin/prohibitin superfamily)